MFAQIDSPHKEPANPLQLKEDAVPPAIILTINNVVYAVPNLQHKKGRGGGLGWGSIIGPGLCEYGCLHAMGCCAKGGRKD